MTTTEKNRLRPQIKTAEAKATKSTSGTQEKPGILMLGALALGLAGLASFVKPEEVHVFKELDPLVSVDREHQILRLTYDDEQIDVKYAFEGTRFYFPEINKEGADSRYGIAYLVQLAFEKSGIWIEQDMDYDSEILSAIQDTIADEIWAENIKLPYTLKEFRDLRYLVMDPVISNGKFRARIESKADDNVVTETAISIDLTNLDESTNLAIDDVESDLNDAFPQLSDWFTEDVDDELESLAEYVKKVAELEVKRLAEAKTAMPFVAKVVVDPVIDFNGYKQLTVRCYREGNQVYDRALVNMFDDGSMSYQLYGKLANIAGTEFAQDLRRDMLSRLNEYTSCSKEEIAARQKTAEQWASATLNAVINYNLQRAVRKTASKYVN